MLDTILIVDDNATQRGLTKHSISEKLKYTVLDAGSVDEALGLVFSKANNISLVLLDMRSEKQESLRLIRAIKRQRKDFPVIVLVEYGEHDYALQAIDAGANDFLTKPVTIERLGLSIASALRIGHLCKLVRKLEMQLEAAVTNLVHPAGYSSGSVQMERDVKIKKLRNMEEDAIRFALNVCGGSMSKAARSLGIGRSTLYRKVGELERHKTRDNQTFRDSQTTRPIMVRSEMEHS